MEIFYRRPTLAQIVARDMNAGQELLVQAGKNLLRLPALF